MKKTGIYMSMLFIAITILSLSSCVKQKNEFTDTRDGKVYKMVTIGEQIWMAENLNYETTDSWWYNNDEANGDIYGRLYTWDAAKNACPSGWHLPSNDGWAILTTYLGGEDVAGGKLKETGTTHWDSPNTGATNSSGFNALSGGNCFGSTGIFKKLDFEGFWWSSEDLYDMAWYFNLDYNKEEVNRFFTSKDFGYSIRCLKNGQSFEEFKDKAKNGDARSQYLLGQCYSSGDGISIDQIKAYKWFKKSAKQGNADAQYSLGMCYVNGEGTSTVMEKAFESFKKSADQGHANAQYRLGICYVNGEGTTTDIEKAFELFKKSAEQGNADGQFTLGLSYKYGRGTNIDEAKAFKWFKKSAEQGDASAQNSLGYCYDNGTGTTVNKEKAFEWYKKSAEQGHSVAQYCLAFCYLNGEGIPADKEKAFHWLYKSAAQGDTDAQLAIGVCYKNGIGTTVNMENAIEWLKKAAENGNQKAEEMLTQMEQ